MGFEENWQRGSACEHKLLLFTVRILDIYFIATPKVKIPLSAPCFQFNEIKRVTVTKIKKKMKIG